MASGLQHTHVGGNWKVNWVQFVDFRPDHTGTVVLNMGRGGNCVFSGVPGGVLSRPGLTHDVLQLDTVTMVATHSLSDRFVETYSTDGGTTSDGYRRLYLTSVTDSNGKTVSLNWQSIAAGHRLTSLTDASGKITTFSYADSANPLRLTGVTDPFGRSNGMAYAATGRLQQVTDSAGNVSSMTYNIRDEITSVVTPLGTSTFARGTLLNAGGQPNGFWTEVTDANGKTDRIERVNTVAAGALPANEPVPPGFAGTNLAGPSTFYWGKQVAPGARTLENAKIVVWARNATTGAAMPVPLIVKEPGSHARWMTYPGQTGPNYAGTHSSPASISQCDPDLTLITTSTTYNAQGSVLSSTDSLGRQTINEYHPNGRDVWRVHRVADAVDTVVATYENYVNGQPGRITAENGGVTLRSYDGAGQMVSQTDALGGITTNAYNAAGLLTGTTDALGRTTTMEYDAQGRETKVTYPGGAFVQRTYDAAGNVLTMTDELGKTTTAVFDSFNRRVSQTDPIGRTTTFAYENQGGGGGGGCCGGSGSAGALSLTTLPSGRATHIDYDAFGRKSAETVAFGTPLAAVTQYGYDTENRVTQITDPANFVTTTGYDWRGRRVSQTDPSGMVTGWNYDTAGRLISVTTAVGTADAATTSTTYDSQDRVLTETDPTGRVTSHAYGFNVTGEFEQVIAPLGRTTTVQRDLLGREVRVTLPDGNFRTTAYDAAGQVVSTTDELGKTTLYTYDARGRRSTVTDPLNRTTTFAYDAAGRQILVTSPGGRQSATSYDDAGQVVAQTQAPGTADEASSTMTYDADGRVLTQTDAAGTVTTFTYNARGERSTVADALGNTQTFTYDSRGLLTGTVNADATTTARTYDAAGRLISQRDEKNDTRTFAYNLRGQLATLTDARASVTGWSYDLAGRLLRKTYHDGTHVDYTYDAAGRLSTRQWVRGVTTTYAYNLRDQVTGMTYSDGTPAVTMSYDAAGRPLEIGNAVATDAYAYDDAGQLAVETQSVAGHPAAMRTLTHSHDADGLRTGLELGVIAPSKAQTERKPKHV